MIYDIIITLLKWLKASESTYYDEENSVFVSWSTKIDRDFYIICCIILEVTSDSSMIAKPVVWLLPMLYVEPDLLLI